MGSYSARHWVETEVKEPRCLVHELSGLADTKHSTGSFTVQQRGRPRTDLACLNSQVGQVGERGGEKVKPGKK